MLIVAGLLLLVYAFTRRPWRLQAGQTVWVDGREYVVVRTEGTNQPTPEGNQP